jgi:hypothetical protein
MNCRSEDEGRNDAGYRPATTVQETKYGKDTSKCRECRGQAHGESINLACLEPGDTGDKPVIHGRFLQFQFPVE